MDKGLCKMLFLTVEFINVIFASLMFDIACTINITVKVVGEIPASKLYKSHK